MSEKQSLGIFGENKACNYLIKHNYKIIERNFKCKHGEIDIIAKDLSKSELVFIEVKTRSSLKYGIPAQAINSYKKKHLIYAARNYILKHQVNFDTFVRFDVIEIFANNYKFKLHHIQQIL